MVHTNNSMKLLKANRMAFDTAVHYSTFSIHNVSAQMCMVHVYVFIYLNGTAKVKRKHWFHSTPDEIICRALTHFNTIKHYDDNANTYFYLCFVLYEKVKIQQGPIVRCEKCIWTHLWCWSIDGHDRNAHHKKTLSKRSRTFSILMFFDAHSRFWQLLRTQVGIRRRFCQLGIDIDARVNYLVSNKRVRSKHAVKRAALGMIEQSIRIEF